MKSQPRCVLSLTFTVKLELLNIWEYIDHLRFMQSSLNCVDYWRTNRAVIIRLCLKEWVLGSFKVSSWGDCISLPCASLYSPFPKSSISVSYVFYFCLYIKMIYVLYASHVVLTAKTKCMSRLVSDWMNIDSSQSSGTFSFLTCALFSLLCSIVGYELAEFDKAFICILII